MKIQKEINLTYEAFAAWPHLLFFQNGSHLVLKRAWVLLEMGGKMYALLTHY